jgi:RNA polymerase sigma factor (sigma-70 family)
MPWDGVCALIDRAKAGDEDAWRRLYDLTQPFLQRQAQRRLGPGSRLYGASDLVADTLLRAWQRLGTFRGGGADDAQTGALFRSWLATIVKRIFANDVRYRDAAIRKPPGGIDSLDAARNGETADPGRDAPADDPSPGYWLRLDEEKVRVATSLAKLDPCDRAVVELHIFQDWTLGRVADHLGLRYDQVRYRLHGALDRLGHELRE